MPGAFRARSTRPVARGLPGLGAFRTAAHAAQCAPGHRQSVAERRHGHRPAGHGRGQVNAARAASSAPARDDQ